MISPKWANLKGMGERNKVKMHDNQSEDVQRKTGEVWQTGQIDELWIVISKQEVSI